MKSQSNGRNLQSEELRGNEQEKNLQQTSTGGQQELGRSGGVEQEGLTQKGKVGMPQETGIGRSEESELDEE